jgi:molecular chaperone HscB
MAPHNFSQRDFSQSYFELFQIPEAYQVDLSVLNKAYRELQQAIHPDRFASGSDQDRRMAVQYASWVNEAYESLKSPVARAHYLLSLKDKAPDAQQTIGNDPAFLMHQMSLREQLMELREADNPEAALDALRDELEELIAHQCDDFEQHFAQADYEHARESVGKMQFLFKLEEDMEKLEAEILDY